MPTYTNKVNAGENLSTIAQNAGMTPQAFAALNPHLAATGANSYQGLNNFVAQGTGYNLAPATGGTGTGTNTGTVLPSSTSTFNVPSGAYQSPETLAAQKAQADYLNSLTNPDQNSIYQQTLAQMQANIDATNNMYADELARAKVAGQGRLGTSSAISARRGLLGSDFGNAQYDTQVAGNEDVYRSIENERLAKVNSILSQAKSDATAEYRNKRDEFTKGLDARLSYYQNADQRKIDNTSKAAKALVAQGLSPDTIDKNSLDQLAKYYGISSEDIKSGYATEKQAADQALADKNKNFTLSAGQSEYQYDPTTKQYKQVASVAPKATASSSSSGKSFTSGKAIFTPSQLTSYSNLIEQSKGPDNYVDPAVYKQAYDAWIQVGGLGKDFLLKYPPKTYVNPVNDTLPTYLRSNKTTSTRSA